MIRRIVLGVAMAAAVAGLAGCGEFPRSAGVQPTRLAQSQATLDPIAARDMINAYRKTKGLKPLKLNRELTEAAEEHSEDLAVHDEIAHRGSDGTNPWDRVSNTGYHPRLAAENVGAGQASLGEVFKGWQNSPGHNENLLLPDAQEMGIALVYNPETSFKTFWTLVLGTKI